MICFRVVRWTNLFFIFSLASIKEEYVYEVKNLSKVPSLLVVLLLMVSGRGGGKVLGV